MEKKKEESNAVVRTDARLLNLEKEPDTRICSACRGTGYKGKRGRYGRAHLKDLEAALARQRAEEKKNE